MLTSHSIRLLMKLWDGLLCELLWHICMLCYIYTAVFMYNYSPSIHLLIMKLRDGFVMRIQSWDVFVCYLVYVYIQQCLYIIIFHIIMIINSWLYCVEHWCEIKVMIYKTGVGIYINGCVSMEGSVVFI